MCYARRMFQSALLLLISTIVQAAPVKVGYSPVLSTAGFFLALDKGYFKEYGLEVEATPFRASSAPMNALLAKGELDVGGGNFTAGLWNANGDSRAIRLVADKGTVSKGHDYIALLVRKDLVSGGKFDLKGKKLAFTATGGTSQEIAAERFLKERGLTPKDVTYLKMPYADMNAAFRTKTLDATVQLEPYVTMAVEEGLAENEGSVYGVYPDQPSAALFYSAKFAKDRPDEATKFMAAYLRGVRDYVAAFGPERKGRDGVIAILNKYTETIAPAVWEKMQPVGLNPDGHLDVKKLAKDLEWYRGHHYVDKAIPVGDLVDDSFVDGALKLIGKAKP
jgi:NitT/TauT family transport system substrate-binding protein